MLNERRQNYENRPYGLASMAMLAALFPPDHPYHWTTIGEVADLRAAKLDEVHQFFRRYYHPANASIALAGDIEPEAALALVRAYFEPIDAGAPVEPVRALASLDGERRILLEDRVELPRLYLAWLTPPMFEPGDAELDLATDLSGQRKNLAPLPPARLRRTDRDRRVRVAELTRDCRASSSSRPRRRRATRWSSSSA